MSNALATKTTPKTSQDYVNALVARRGKTAAVSHEAKVQKLSLILQDETNGIKRLGVGMIGPIQLKLRYQGLTRNILVEDPITPGTPLEYDVWDDLGQAYTLSGVEGEVRITAFEGKRAPVSFFRIASRPSIMVEDLYYMRINMVEQAQDETKQAILKQEDLRLIVLLQAALNDYATRPDHVISPNHAINETSGVYTPGSFYTAVAQTDLHELISSRILINAADVRDLYRWDINTTGWAFKDQVVAGETITKFGEFDLQRSIIVPTGELYLLPNPEFLGVFPILYSLQVEENHNVEEFRKGWVFHEMVSMAVLNPRGIASITKS